MRWGAAAILAVFGMIGAGGLWGCSLSQNYTQCNQNSDCKPVGGVQLFCTPDHLCVQGTPDADLCTQTYPTSPPVGAVQIGVLAQLNAQLGGSDGPELQALEQGVDEINSFMSAGQRPLALNICDTTATPFDALKSMQILTQQRGVVAVIGPSTSAEVLSVADEVASSGVPIVSPSATAAALSQLPQRAQIFRMAPSDNQQGPVLAKLVTKAAVKLALVYVDDPYGDGLQGSFVSAWGNTPVVTQAVTAGDQAEITQAINNVLAAQPLDYAVLIESLDAKAVLSGLSGLPSTTQILMTDSAENNTVLSLLTEQGAPAVFTAVKGTAPGVDPSSMAYETFASGFKGKYGISPSSDDFAAYGYDCLYSVAVAIGNAKGGTVTGSIVAAGLHRITGAGAQVPVGQSNYLTAVQQMASGQDVPLSGASGPIQFNADGSREQTLFDIWSIQQSPPQFNNTLAP